MKDCTSCGLAFVPSVDSPVCDECQQKVLSAISSLTPEKTLMMGASQRAITSAVSALKEGRRPDFTVTAASFREGGPNFFILAWETVSAGFGELTFYLEGGKLKVDDEGMGARFCQEVFERLLDQTMPKEDRTPRSSLKPQPYGNYEGHDLRRADMPILWSVGATPEEAIQALCQERWNGTLESMGEPLGGGDTRFTWGYRFLSDNGTGFKAAGIHLPGGVALTWWK